MFRVFAAGPIRVKAGFEESVELAARFGFDGVAIDPGYARSAGPETVVRMLRERGLQAGPWGLPIKLLGPEAEYRAQLEDLPAVAECCGRIGALRASTWVPCASDESPYAELFDLLLSRVREIAAVLDAHGGRLGLEFVGPATLRAGKKYEFIHTMDQMLTLCRAVPTGNVGLLLDAFHLFTSGGRMDDVLALSDPQIVNVHVNDGIGGVPAEEQLDGVRELPNAGGAFDCARFLANLKRIGYTGPVIVEPFCSRLAGMPAEDAVRATKEALDGVWPD
ncbi:MAG: TIM barrel protein [Candidatus Brocadiaceae bacterium]|nr:TIM barrel protein [Candidatus Brocadiaceae bacterium]